MAGEPVVSSSIRNEALNGAGSAMRYWVPVGLYAALIFGGSSISNPPEAIASLLKDAAYEIFQAVQRLEKNPAVATEHAQRAKTLENRVEGVYREAIADLFTGPEDVHHIVEILKLREVYRHLSNAADRGDEAGNIIADIVVKKT